MTTKRRPLDFQFRQLNTRAEIFAAFRQAHSIAEDLQELDSDPDEPKSDKRASCAAFSKQLSADRSMSLQEAFEFGDELGVDVELVLYRPPQDIFQLEETIEALDAPRCGGLSHFRFLCRLAPRPHVRWSYSRRTGETQFMDTGPSAFSQELVVRGTR